MRVDERKDAQLVGSEPKDEVLEKINLPKSPAISAEEENIRNLLKVAPNSQREDLLINALAIEKLEKHFAIIYVRIFGSQIAFLRRLNEVGGVLSRVDTAHIYKEIRSRIPELSDWDFEIFVSYLQASGLISVGDRIELSPWGQEFMLFLVKYRLSQDKPL